MVANFNKEGFGAKGQCEQETIVPDLHALPSQVSDPVFIGRMQQKLNMQTVKNTFQAH
jgi:hypothetical protein